ncbi:MAG: hypothetical protein IKF14_03270 [Atopobiaceae bacterium]|nr:hypothetical protein [Atopobiaceae bacterium]
MRKKTVLGSLVIFALVLVFACAVAVRVPRGGHEGLAPEKAVAADTRPARRGGPAGEGNPQDGEISARDTGPGSEDASRAESVGATGLGDDGAAPAGGEEQDEFEQDSGKELGEPDHTRGGQGTTLEGSEAPEAARADSRSVVLAGASEADAGEEVGAQTVGEPAVGGPAEGRDGDVDESSAQSGEEGPEDGGEESVDLSVAGSEEDEQVFELPEGAAYEPEEVLLSVDSGASAEDVEALLAKVPGIAAQSVDAADVSSGLLCVELEPGASVEDAINAVRAARSHR